MSLKINTLDITSGNYALNELRFDDSPPIQFSELPFASDDGAKFISSRYTPKSISLRGRISGTSQANLETNIDTFKETLLKDTNINLNSSYAGGFRQWVGNVSQLSITRDNFNVTYALYDIAFQASDPFGYDVSSIDADPAYAELYSFDNFGGNQLTHTFTCEGTAPPLVRWRYLLDTISGQIEKLVFKSKTTGMQMELNNAFSVGDEVVINPDDKTVTLNAFDIDYEGVFPEFKIGGNEFQWNIYGNQSFGYQSIIEDQSQTTAISRMYILSPYGWGQTFTAGVTKTLRKISLDMSGLSPFTAKDVVMKLWSTSGALPDTLLETSTVHLDSLPISSWINFSFNTSQTSGLVYAFTIEPSWSTLDTLIWEDNHNNLYSGGQMISKTRSGIWYPQSGFDLTFKTYYETVAGGVFEHSSDIKLDYKKRYL